MTEISIVIPAFNSERSLPELVAQLGNVLPRIADQFELILVDDGSPDGTWQVASALAAEHQWIKPIRLMRNFGQHNALLCGVRAAQFDAIVTMDDDLQHSPALIEILLAKLHEGFDVVYGYPQDLKHGILRNMASEITKTVLQKAMGASTARHISPFRAFRKELRDCFANYCSPFVNLDVLLSWSTANFTFVLVPHSERVCGASSYTVAKLITHTVNMLTGFSILPLQLASICGFVCIAFGFLALALVFAMLLVGGGPPPGFPFLASVIIIFSGAQLLTLGIMGEYLARMYVRMSDRPPYVVRRNESRAQLGVGKAR